MMGLPAGPALLVLFISFSMLHMRAEAQQTQCVPEVEGFPSCVCDFESYYTIWCCADRKPTDPPPTRFPRFPDTAYTMHLSGCGITHLPDDWCSNCNVLSYLSLRNNSLKNITTRAFDKLGALHDLDLSDNKDIEFIEKGALAPLQSLFHLRIMNNPKLGIDFIKNVTHGLSKNNTLFLSFDNTNTHPAIPSGRSSNILYDSDLREINGTYIQMLGLGSTNLSFIRPQALKDMHTLRCINLESNHFNISSFPNVLNFLSKFTVLPSLVALDLHNQNGDSWKEYTRAYLKKLCDIASYDKKYLKELCVAPPKVDEPSKSKNKHPLPGSLTHLNIESNPGYYVFGNFSVSRNSLTYINMANCGSMNLTGPIVGLNCLYNFTLTNTSLTVFDPKTLSSLPALHQLRLRNCDIRNQKIFDKDTVFKKMTLLDLGRNNLTTIAFTNLQQVTPKLRNIYLDYNNFKSVPPIISTTLHFINLSYNSFTYLTKEDRNSFQNLIYLTVRVGGHPFKIDLSYNFFHCTCNSEELDSVEWMQKHSRYFFGFGYYQCTRDGQKYEKDKMIIGDMDVWKTRVQCKLPLIFTVSGTVVAVFFFSLGIFLAYRKKWLLQYRMFQVREILRGKKPVWWRSRGSERIPLFSRVYIIYSTLNQEDRIFAEREIKPLVENVDLVPLYHARPQPVTPQPVTPQLATPQQEAEGDHRDIFFHPGVDKAKNILKAFENSVCCIVIISDNFLDSLDSSIDTETKLAMNYAEGCSKDYLLPVVKRPLNIHKLLKRTSATARGLLRLPRTAEFPQCEEGQELSPSARDNARAARDQIQSWIANRARR